MIPPPLSVEQVFRTSMSFVGFSLISELVFYRFGSDVEIRAAFGSLGLMSGLCGSGVSFWFSIRSRSPKLIAAALLSAGPLAFWCWEFHRIMTAQPQIVFHPAA